MLIKDRIKELLAGDQHHLTGSLEFAIGGGVYAIANTNNLKVYVGSAMDIRERLRTHRKQLKGNRHPNKHLQSSWNKHGASAFVVVVLESTEGAALVVREQYWIDCLQSSSDGGYNLRKTASSNLGLKFTDEQKRRVSAARLGNRNAAGTKQTPETIAKRRVKLIGQKRHWSPESRAKLAALMRERATGKCHNAKTYDGLIDPCGACIGPIHNLTAFCRQRGLRRANLLMVLNGQRHSHQGWTAVAK